MRAPYPFGAAAAAALSPQQGAALPHGQSEASLDPSDFPALGSAGAPSAPGQPSSAAASLLSSYASQAGQSSINGAAPGLLSPGAAGAPGAPVPGNGAGAPGQPGQRRDFSSHDDFPALGGAFAGAAGGPPQLPPGMGAAPGPGAPGDLAGLAAGINGLSLAAAAAAQQAGRAVASPGGQEQASALAALQAQQQHRANLLGSMNGQRNASGAGFQSDKQQTPTYPAGLLPNGTPGAASSASSPLPPSSNAPSSADQPHPQQQQLRTPPNPAAAAAAAGALLAAAAVGAGGPFASAANAALPPPTAGVTTGQVPQTAAQQVLFSPADRYGLLGLLHVIKTSDPDTSMLALGTDLTNLGLDLGSSENLYSTFITPWADSKAAQVLNIEPEFHLPSCYNVQPPPANTKIGNFSDETLFFIFYSQPRDMMQEMAAHELYKHNWRYHKELRLWLTKEAGTEPVQKTATFERGSYIFFDPVLWERVRKDYVLFFDQLETIPASSRRLA
ncbi:hypothetical protein Rhopal_005858-T1 [Rhodotorula paludigena]|uniref:NOT2/NOT3/NOT5 C-terminal domain-containing protein n=1 Tax=Rhodotorula paludigena TaxID=86838 RepID=A0AAV5GTJ6_9BASI|nr:hypothetical protein Rhopal_005858-T1 [Rhodotorula paludigena]